MKFSAYIGRIQFWNYGHSTRTVLVTGKLRQEMGKERKLYKQISVILSYLNFATGYNEWTQSDIKITAYRNSWSEKPEKHKQPLIYS